MEMNQAGVPPDHCAACPASCSDSELHLPAGAVSNSLIFPLIGFVAGACLSQLRDLSDGLALLLACIGLLIGALLSRAVRIMEHQADGRPTQRRAGMAAKTDEQKTVERETAEQIRSWND